jgi:thiol-disulfide isomerase/thioredoxin
MKLRMKTLSLLSIVFVLSASMMGQATTGGIINDPYTGSEILYGIIGENLLRSGSSAIWFEDGYASYLPERNSIIAVARLMPPDAEVVIVLGTWCHDSQREVPRMIKVLNSAGVYSNRIRLIAVDTKKQAEGCGLETLNIEKVPTLILMQNGEERGRIIETPVTLIETDLMEILAR